MTNKEINSILNDTTKSKSKRMIELYNNGVEITQISELFAVRYNFVYNVVSNFCRMNDVELRTNRDSSDSKKAKIIAMLQEGKTKTEIAKELQVYYNYVFKVEKEMKAQ